LNAVQRRGKVIFIGASQADGTVSPIVNYRRASLIRASFDEVESEAALFPPKNLLAIDAQAVERADERFGDWRSRQGGEKAGRLSEHRQRGTDVGLAAAPGHFHRARQRLPPAQVAGRREAGHDFAETEKHERPFVQNPLVTIGLVSHDNRQLRGRYVRVGGTTPADLIQRASSYASAAGSRSLGSPSRSYSRCKRTQPNQQASGPARPNRAFWSSARRAAASGHVRPEARAPAEIRGPFDPIATKVPGLQICELLPRLAGMADQFALVRSVSQRNSNHTPMIYYTLTGRHTARPNEDNDIRPPQREDFPHLGSVVAKFKPARLRSPAISPCRN
jgi:hypothetical protein